MFFEISGIGQTKFGELYDKSLEDLIFMAVDLALKDANKSLSEIDAVFIGNMLGGSHLGALFGNGVPAFRVEAACASGGVAIYNAMVGLKSGMYKNVLVVGVEKMTDYSASQVQEMLMQAASSSERESGITFAGLYALMTKAYEKEFGLNRDELSMVSVLMHQNACNNSNAQFCKKFTVNEVNNSKMVAEPLRLLDCSPISDGASAVVISAVTNPLKDSAYLADSVMTTDVLNLADRENLFSMKATVKAVKNFDVSKVEVVELHDCFSIALVMALEDMGFARRGEGLKLVEEIYKGKSSLILNPSGGLKACGHPVGATGVKQVIEVVKQIRSGKTLGLTHNIGGTGATCVMNLIANGTYYA